MHDHVALFSLLQLPMCAIHSTTTVHVTSHSSASLRFRFILILIQANPICLVVPAGFLVIPDSDLTRMRKGGCLRSGFVNHICSDVQAVTAPDNHSASVESLACQTPHKLSSNNNQIRDLPKLIWEEMKERNEGEQEKNQSLFLFCSQ